ncbi:MAG: tRNA-modifying protein YgfZ, partial [Gemmatimonadales bacterium]|nr:tRNA-modifying protein YgfZ [Gemmatimonadales bacterium]
PVPAATGSAPPPPGQAGAVGTTLIGTGPTGAPFAALMVGETAEIAGMAIRFEAAGGTIGDPSDVAAQRVLAGWPTLGREIDDRMIPQEARLDQIGGISFTKGCYTGQETVVRIHHRGHVNRLLRGVVFPGEAPLIERRAMFGGKEIGVVRSALAVGGATLALATLRREVSDGARISAGEREGEVVALPFASVIPNE